MNNEFNAWTKVADSAGDEIAAANRALDGGRQKVVDADFSYRMALASGNHSEIFAAENRFKAAIEEDIRRRGGLTEDVLAAHSNFHYLGQTEKNSSPGNWLLLLGLAASLYLFAKISV